MSNISVNKIQAESVNDGLTFLQKLEQRRAALYRQSEEGAGLTEEETGAICDEQNRIERQISLIVPTTAAEAAAQMRVLLGCYKDAHPSLPNVQDMKADDHQCEAVDAALMERVLGFLESQGGPVSPVADIKWQPAPGFRFMAYMDEKPWTVEPVKVEGGQHLVMTHYHLGDQPDETRTVTDEKEVQALCRRFSGVRTYADFFERPNLWRSNDTFAANIGKYRKHPAYQLSLAAAGARRQEIRRYVCDKTAGALTEEQEEALWAELDAVEQKIADGPIMNAADLRAAVAYARHIILNDYSLGDHLEGNHVHLLDILQGFLRLASQPKI